MCLESIVTLGVCPDEGESLSGFQLIKAPGMSIKTLADTASESYTRGTQLAMDKKQVAIGMVRNDLVAMLQSNKVATTIVNPEYRTSQFNANNSVTSSGTERGVVLHKAGWKGSLRSTYIRSIELYPLQSADVDLKIYDGYNTYAYPVSLTGGQVNVFDESNLSGFPFKINNSSSLVKVLVQQDTAFVSAPITCMKGCNGTGPNPCAWADGWDGDKYVRNEGYGINLNFYCSCDYEQILCDLAKSFSGELIWLKWQMEILEEAKRSDRFNNWIIYGQDKLADEIASLDRKYAARWNNLVDAMPGILKTYRDDCLDCRGTRWVTNL